MKLDSKEPTIDQILQLYSGALENFDLVVDVGRTVASTFIFGVSYFNAWILLGNRLLLSALNPLNLGALKYLSYIAFMLQTLPLNHPTIQLNLAV